MSSNMIIIGIVNHIHLGKVIKCMNRKTRVMHHLAPDSAWNEIIVRDNRAKAWKEQIAKLINKEV